MADALLFAGLAMVPAAPGAVALRARRRARRTLAPPRARLTPLLRPAVSGDGHTPSAHRRAATLVGGYALDSLDPFALREDKRFHFADGGMLAYRTLRETAVVSGDPIGPPDRAPAVLESFLRHAHEQGWAVAVTGASDRHLEAYRALGLRTMHIGNEAVVDPRSFSLEGRAIRKVRQSVARVTRRGWTVELVGAPELSDELIDELGTVERRWRADQDRIVGFAMTLGRLWGADEDADGLYVLARNPDGELRAFLRFAAYREGLSLDASRRLGDEPNGLNEAMVVAALEHARDRGLAEVSLNFAGFAHLMAPEGRVGLKRRMARAAIGCAHGRFQLERLVRFNEKFFPSWRPRYLVYQRRALLPLAGLRVLQAEGYVRPPRSRAVTSGWRPLPRPVGRPAASLAPPGATR